MRRLLLIAVLALCLLILFSASAWAEDADAKRSMEHYLLVGVDGWGVNEEGSARSDAIILTSLDYDRDRITFTSFARDSIVNPSYRKGTVKLNTLVRSAEGEHALIDYLEEAFGIPIGGYFVINFSGAVDVIDAVGGITVELTEDEAVYLRHHAGDYENYTLAPGACRINGAQALYYMRCRSLDNDFGRQGRQGNVLRAVMKELADITPMRALTLLDDILKMYRTDLRIGQQMDLVRKAISLRSADVRMHSLPAEGTYRYGSDSQGTSGLEFDLQANREILYELLEIQLAATQETLEQTEKTPEPS